MGSIQSKSKSTRSSLLPSPPLQMNSTASKPVNQQVVLSTSTLKSQPLFDIVDLINADLPVSQAVSSISHSTPTTLHIPELARRNSEEILEVWNQSRTSIHYIEEYHEAQSAIILEPKWLKHTKLQKYIRYIDQEFKKNPALKATMHSQSEFTIMLHRLIAKAYPEKKDNPRSVYDIVHGCNICESVMKLYPNLRWRQPYLTYALYLLHQHAQPDTIVSKLSETCDRANRCSSAQRQAFNILICAAYNSNTMKSTNVLTYDDLSTKEGALMRVYECIEDFLDDHKERAFMSAFMAPARFYYHITHNDFGKDHVNVHGLNWYLALLHSTLGIQLPYLAEMGDDGLIGVVDFWNGLTDDAWSSFSDPMNFGLDFEGIQTFKNKSSHNLRSFLKKTVNDNEFPLGHRTTRPKILGNDAVNTNQQSSEIRRKLSIYLNRFVTFFKQDFLVKKLFETLNSEMKPEHNGFRKAFETLYQVYRSECLSDRDADSYVDHCYVDEYYTTLNIHKTGRFLSWLRVTKANIFPEEVHAVVSVDDSIKSVDDTCPICFEVKSDITQLEHTNRHTSYGGDLSGHRMCQDCRISYGKDECPFCKETIEGKESDGFINTFIDLYTTVNKNDHNALACIFEEWQLFELEFSSSVNVTNHVSEAIINHHSFKSYLRDCIATQTPALRDAAGYASFITSLFYCIDYVMYHNDPILLITSCIIMIYLLPNLCCSVGILFRFHAMVSDREINITHELKAQLDATIEIIFNPLEHPSSPIQLHGHHYGALFQQALSAWLCAFRKNRSTRTIVEIIKRTIRAIIHCADILHRQKRLNTSTLYHEMSERIYQEIAVLASQHISECVAFNRLIYR